MPTLEELLNLKDQTLSSFLPKEDTEEAIVSDALASPIRPEYLKFLEEKKKEAISRPEGARSFLGTTSPEERALKDLNEYDRLRGLSSGQKSAFDSRKLQEMTKALSPVASPASASASSTPFFPTPTGAPIPEEQPIKISSSAPIRAPASAVFEKAPVEEPQLAALLASGQKQESQYEDLLKRYKEAQDRQKLAQLGVSIGQAAEKFGSSIAMVKPGDQSFYEQQMKLAGGITDQFKEEEAVRREAEKNDPKSEASVAMRGLLKEQGINVPDNISAAFIEKQYPQFANIINRKESAKQEAVRRAERAQDRQDRMLERLDFKQREEALRLAPKIQNKKYETYTELNAQKNLVDEAVANPSPQRDITVYYSFVKALDPESVVREGELKFVQTSRSIPDDLRGTLQRALTGKPMLPKERLEIQKFMNQRLGLARRQWEDSAAPYLAQAEKAGISRDLIAPGTTAMTAPSEAKQKETIKLPQKQTGKAGKTIVSKDGKRYIVNADETTATEI